MDGYEKEMEEGDGIDRQREEGGGRKGGWAEIGKEMEGGKRD